MVAEVTNDVPVEDGDVMLRPLAVIFDVNETLFDLRALTSFFVARGFPPYALDWWFAVLLRDGIAAGAAGGYAAFPELARDALDEVAGRLECPLDDEAAVAILQEFGRIPAHPDVVPALRILEEQQTPYLALTNGSGQVATNLFAGAGLSVSQDQILSVEITQRWKPCHEPYDFAITQLGIPSNRVAMVASHPWDLAGASAAGLVTAWVNRSSRNFPRAFRSPNAMATTLDALMAQLVAAPAS